MVGFFFFLLLVFFSRPLNDANSRPPVLRSSYDDECEPDAYGCYDVVWNTKTKRRQEGFFKEPRPNARLSGVTAFVFGDLLFVLGSSPQDEYDGVTLHEFFVTNLALRPKVREWERLPSFAGVQSTCFFVDGDGRLWAAGGMVPSYCPTCAFPTRQCWSIQLTQGGQISWRTEAKLPFAARYLEAVSYQDGVLVVGGKGGGELDEHHLAYIAFLNDSGSAWSPVDCVTGKIVDDANVSDQTSDQTSDQFLRLHRPMIHVSAIQIEI